MTTLLAQVSLNRTSNIPRDRIVNTFHFRTEAAFVPQDATDINVQLVEFYEVGQPATPGLGLRAYLGGLALTGHTLKVYDLADAEPRVPRASFNWTWSSSGSTALMLPAEVALCLSYSAPQPGGVPLNRLRGRVYLGPWSAASDVEGTALEADARPHQNLLNLITMAAKRMIDHPNSEPKWAVYSALTNAAREIRTAWVDNAWDTQRRRGASPTARTQVVGA